MYVPLKLSYRYDVPRSVKLSENPTNMDESKILLSGKELCSITGNTNLSLGSSPIILPHICRDHDRGPRERLT